MLFLLMGINCVSADNFDVNKFVDEYGQEVQSIIKSNLNYKGTENATSSVSYTIHPDGSVTDIKIEQKSGTGLDKAVVEAVENQLRSNLSPKKQTLQIL